ncbi:Eukaryotic peptide chain release factor GTP-binding subunit [Linderina pennispora]|nr:Eukaryotic peptide chain release factor GTP-binding subunit [Linderina pennispora]
MSVNPDRRSQSPENPAGRELDPRKPAPIGLYEPVDEKTLMAHPERFTSDGLRRKERMYRLYEHENWHLFRGRLVTGNKPVPFIAAVCMIAAPVVLFAIFVCPYLWTDMHKAAVVVFAYITALVLSSMMMASLSDPGIIPRNLDAISADSIGTSGSTMALPKNPEQGIFSGKVQIVESSKGTSDEWSNSSRNPLFAESQLPSMQYYEKLPPPWVPVKAPGSNGAPLSVYDPKLPTRGHRSMSDPSHRFPPITKEVRINDTVVRLKYCETCRIFRPPRASHCKYCDNCVENEDHHCIWLNNCVGRRNYRYFYTFVGSTVVLALYIASLSLARLLVPLSNQPGGFGGDLSFKDMISRHPVVLALVIYAVLLVLPLSGLFVYHTVLISRNLTTHEVIGAKHSGRFDDKPDARLKKNVLLTKAISPYSRGSCLSNWAAILCGPSMPPNIQWRKRVDPEGIEELLPLHH